MDHLVGKEQRLEMVTQLQAEEETREQEEEEEQLETRMEHPAEEQEPVQGIRLPQAGMKD